MTSHVTKTIPFSPPFPPTPETMLKHYNGLTYITEVINNIEWWGVGGGVAYFKLTIVKLFKISKVSQMFCPGLNPGQNHLRHSLQMTSYVTKTIPFSPPFPPTPETMLKHYNGLTYITEVINNIEWWGVGGGVAYFKLTIVKLFKISKVSQMFCPGLNPGQNHLRHSLQMTSYVTKTIPFSPPFPPTPETMLKHYNGLTYITEVINNIEWWGVGGGVAYFKLTIVKLFKISKVSQMFCPGL